MVFSQQFFRAGLSGSARRQRLYNLAFAVGLPVTVVVGDRDQVDHEDTLEEVFARFLPQATFRRLRGVGHLSPLEAPDALADACNALLHDL